MSRIFLPPKVDRELRENTRHHNASVNNVTYTDATCEKWTRELRQLDPLLRMVRAYDKPVIGMQLVPGCYHIVRDNPGAPVTITPICNNRGGYMEPPGALLEKLKTMDLQNPQVERMRRQILEAEERAAEKQDEVDRERRIDTAMEHWKAGTQVRISFDQDHRWTQNVAGQRARKS